MAQYIDIRTLNFLLNDIHGLNQLLQLPRFQEHDLESLTMFLDSVKDFSDRELYPCFKEMDEKPAYFEDGKIIVHPQIGTAMKQGGELGLMRLPLTHEEGGLQIPLLIHTAAYAIMEAANNHVPGYLGLTYGAAELILYFGNEELKNKYAPKMLDGEWAGTMCLTEPQAGSSLSDITTSAVPAGDGSFRMKGQKIFISGGDHEYVDNLIHLVLARIEGAPAGTKGISLFVVPKKRLNADNSLSPNDVTTAGDFQKMGQRGYCTSHLIFGEKDDCHGWLVGEAHKGLKYMFQMMNGARIAVGRGGAAIALAAYHASHAYAQERPQGRRVQDSGKKDVTQEPTLIINHPDVRRMLLFQKAVGEGSLSLVFQAARYYDLSVASVDEKDRKKYYLLLELLTPIVKTYPTEMGTQSVSNGVQVLGGYGYCSEYILQQYYRDIRIFPIYEGTTGIQSIDLLGRKMMMENGTASRLLAQEINETIQAALTHDDFKKYAKTLGANLKLTADVMDFLGGFAKNGEFERYLSDATIFMEFLGTIVVGWQWLKMAVEAKNALLAGKTDYPESFYESKIHTMKFYFKYEMPKTTSLAETLMSEEVLTVVEEKEGAWLND